MTFLYLLTRLAAITWKGMALVAIYAAVVMWWTGVVSWKMIYWSVEFLVGCWNALTHNTRARTPR